jgi:tetratricopeptide (TPR) repeat protein
MANVYVTRGDLDGAMQLYQQSLDIKEGLGDLQGKSATLHAMANVYVTRGDLDGAMQLYQQSLDIFEGLGDLQGKSATLANMGVVLYQRREYKPSLQAFLQALVTLEKMGALPDARTVAGWVVQLRRELGGEKFDPLWREVTNNSPLPDWLAQSPSPQPSPEGRGSQEQGITVEQFIAGAIQSAREKRSEAEEYFKSAQKMAADSSAPQELQQLGRVLQRIMLGDRNVDLSSLPMEWAELVERTVHEYDRE